MLILKSNRIINIIILRFPKKFTDTPEGQLSWTSVYKAVSDSGFDDILKVIELLQSLPSTSVRNECGFSIMKLAKTKRRGRLNINSLNNLMVVNQLGQSIAEFDPRPAIENFMVNNGTMHKLN
ncbi:hypothetical protein DPMN_053408 [Dreissena polymorpha]|uniref:HAT C-terminal dimerisation domain-containing protein n=1 Tax=Dreissena polymorpha TaxID=45954 RepID=A0A9D4CMJ8_DREPO|nr:hypothetical protein DPMN_053408 [Dreissena polymorpha]